MALEERYQGMWDFVGKVQSDGWPFDPDKLEKIPSSMLHAFESIFYKKSRTLTASKKFWPPQPLKTHGEQFLGQVLPDDEDDTIVFHRFLLAEDEMLDSTIRRSMRSSLFVDTVITAEAR